MAEIRSPVAKLSTFRIFLLVCNLKNFHIIQIDIKNAYLNGEIKGNAYIEIPEFVAKREGMVCKLWRSIYGLKESSLIWNNTINDILIKIGFRRSTSDFCLYILHRQKDVCYLMIYVDDIVLGSNSEKMRDEIVALLNKNFKLRMLGMPKRFLGMNLYYKNNKVFIEQRDVIENTAKEFLSDEGISKAIYSPMQNKLSLPSIENGNCTKIFQRLLGQLMYLMLCTRPDICFCISCFGQFQKSAGEEHYHHLLNVLMYLYSTREMKLCIGIRSEDVLECFVDASYCSFLNSKSVTGYCLRMYGNLIS